MQLAHYTHTQSCDLSAEQTYYKPAKTNAFTLTMSACPNNVTG